MIIYLIRHGESELNAKNMHQGGDAPLSQKGIEQSHQLANRFEDIPVDFLISSPFERTKKTAEIISKKTNLQVVFNPLLVEIKRPTEIEGKGYEDPKALAIKKTIYENWQDPSYKYSDEETFFEFKDRAIKVINVLSALNKKHVLVVTHGELIRMVVLALALGNDFKPQDYLSFRKLFQLGNTGITILNYEESKWKLMTWNDLYHIPV